jgi:hypothetical protein
MSLNGTLKDALQFSLRAAHLAQITLAAADSIACRISVRIIPLVPKMLG